MKTIDKIKKAEVLLKSIRSDFFIEMNNKINSGFKMSSLSEKLGVGVSTFSRIMHGKENVKDYFILSIYKKYLESDDV